MSAYPSQGDRGENWAAFAGIVFLVLGIFNIVDGIAALDLVLDVGMLLDRVLEPVAERFSRLWRRRLRGR